MTVISSCTQARDHVINFHLVFNNDDIIFHLEMQKHLPMMRLAKSGKIVGLTKTENQ